MPDRRDPNQPWTPITEPPPPPPGPGSVSRKGGYPAGDKPPSELKTPIEHMIRRVTGGVIPAPHVPAGRLVAGTVQPPHRCDPAQIWADLGGKTRTIDDEEFPDADPSVRIECACGEQWTPVPPPSWWSYAGLYRDGWLRVVEPKEYPSPAIVGHEAQLAARRAERWAKVRAWFGHHPEEDTRA